MAQVRQHVNARLTPRQRRAMVDVVIVEGWGVAATAERFQVDPKTVRKWRDRFVAEGPGGWWTAPVARTGRRGAVRRRCAPR